MKSVILTGAAGGIGMETVRLLVQQGYTVYAGYMDEWEAGELKKLKAELNSPLVIPVQLDVREAADVEAVVSRVEAEAPDLAGVIANGGVCSLAVPLEHVDFAITRDAYETNLIGNARLAQRTIPLLKKSRGRIIFVGSLWGIAEGPNLMSYSASKHALEALCTCARRELKQFGIEAVMINPGVVKHTYMTGKQFEQCKEFLIKQNVAPERISKKTFDPGKNTKLIHAVPVPDPNYVNDYAGLNWMLAQSLDPNKMKIVSSAIDCARAIMQGLLAPRPKTRYIVGGDAKALVFLGWLLPARWMDAIMHKISVRP
jgi:NAD(P)-dependent dehydrogenase (short-subunit alcohol dehydrogenase family)